MSHLPDYFEHLVRERRLFPTDAIDRLACVQNGFANSASRRAFFAKMAADKGSSGGAGGTAGRKSPTSSQINLIKRMADDRDEPMSDDGAKRAHRIIVDELEDQVNSGEMDAGWLKSNYDGLYYEKMKEFFSR